MWSASYCTLILCLGVFFWKRTRKVLSELPRETTLGAFLWEHCSGRQRRTIAGTILRAISGGTAVQTLLLLTMLRVGGAGCLVWYALFSLLWLRPIGAFETLRRYYGRGEESCLQFLLKQGKERRGAPARPKLEWVLGLLEAMTFLSAVLVLPQLWKAVSAPAEIPWLPLLLLAVGGGVICLLGGYRLRVAAGLLFLLFLAAGLLANLTNLFPVLEIVLSDAVQRSRAVFALSGAGLAAAIRSGMQVSAFTAMRVGGMAPNWETPAEHPAYYGFCAQVCEVAQVAVQMIVGLLFLCTNLVPSGNEWLQRGIVLLLQMFSLVFCGEIGALLIAWKKKSQLATGAVLLAVALCCQLWAGGTVLQSLFWSMCGLFSVAAAGLLLADESWYFLILENYRDRRIWHVEPHPDIIRDKPEM